MGCSLYPLPVVNCAISGATTHGLPTGFKGSNVVVVYIGSNDLKRGWIPEDIAGRLETYIGGLGSAQVVVLASIKSPDREHYWDQVEAYNKLQEAICAKDPENRYYVDVNSCLQGHFEFFNCDGVHLTWNGLDALGRFLKPELEKAWSKSLGEENRSVVA